MRPLLLAFALLVPFSVSAQNIALTQVASGFDLPLGIAHAGDTRLFIIQQRGRVSIFDGTNVSAQPFLDLSSLVSCCNERGLLGLAFHPRYRDNGFFFVDYTDRNGNTVVARYSVSASDPNRADPASARVLLNVTQPFANHNGGHLAFGPDGFLYIALGDGGSGGDPGNRAQDLSTLLGKILRIDVDSGATYAIPPSNPFATRAGARGEIWAFGCAIRGASASIASPAISGSATSDRAPGKRLTTSRPRASAARTTGGGAWKERTATTRRRTAAMRR